MRIYKAISTNQYLCEYLFVMKILIVSATSDEIAPLLNSFNPEGNAKNGLKVFTCNDISINVLITGVGMVSTAFWLGKTLSKNTYDFALNFGIAGSFDRNIEIGSVVNVTEDCFAEMGAKDGEEFLSVVDLGLVDTEQFSLKNNLGIDNSVLNKLPKVSGITVNTVHGDKESIKKVREIYNPSTESMEGAAFLFACLNEKVSCAQIRAISNYIEKRNKDNWNIQLAIDNLNKKALQIIKTINNNNH